MLFYIASFTPCYAVTYLSLEESGYRLFTFLASLTFTLAWVSYAL